MVRYRVYCVTGLVARLWTPPGGASRRGMTTVSSWMMMLAVIYGMMPSAKIDKAGAGRRR